MEIVLYCVFHSVVFMRLNYVVVYSGFVFKFYATNTLKNIRNFFSFFPRGYDFKKMPAKHPTYFILVISEFWSKMISSSRLAYTTYYTVLVSENG